MAWIRLGGCCLVYSPILRSRRFQILGFRFLHYQIQEDTRLAILLVKYRSLSYLDYTPLGAQKSCSVYINKLLELGVLVPSNSEYASPVHLVPKKDGDYRIIGDFRLLKKQTKLDRHPIPFLTDFADAMAGSTVFSSLDLYKSYYQQELAPSSVHKTAMCTLSVCLHTNA